MYSLFNKYSTMRRLLHLSFLCLLFSSFTASAANRYWRGIAAGLWSQPINWSTTPGGAIGASVPGPNDVAIFANGGSGLVIFDVPSVTVQKIQIDANFTGQLLVTVPMTLTGAADGRGFEMSGQNAIVTMAPLTGPFQCLAAFEQTRGAFTLITPANHLISGNFLVDGTGTDAPSFTVSPNTSITFGGDFRLLNPSAFAALTNSVVIFSKAAAAPTNIEIANVTGVTTFFYNVVFNEDVNATGNNHVNFINGTRMVVSNLLDIQSGILSGDGTSGITLLGNVQSSGNIAPVGPGDATITAALEFAGTSDQTVNFAGTDFDKWSGPVIVNKPAGNTSVVTLSAPWFLNGTAQTMTFTNGLVVTTSANGLIFGATATAVGANAASFVDGPVEKRGAAAFTFPVGDAGVYAPVHLSDGAYGDPFEVARPYVVTYVRQPTLPDFPNTNNPPSEGGVPYTISQCEYWYVDYVGAPVDFPPSDDQPIIWLSYEDQRSCGLKDPTTVGIMAWLSFTPLGAYWTPLLNSNDGLTVVDGVSYISAGLRAFSVGNFNPVFAFGSLDPILNPLPVNWLSFTGRYVNAGVELNWSTAMELNNETYTIERSADGHTFSAIGTVAGRGNTSQTSYYNFTDAQPLTGDGFYRIRQTDRDGKFSYSKMIRVSSSESTFKGLRLFPNPITASMPLTMENANWRNKKVNVIVYNAVGAIVSQQQINFGSDSRAKLNLSGLQKGSYFISSYLNGEKQTLPFFVQ